MRITFLGTGPSNGIPRAGHDDPACLDAVRGGKSRRRRSSALVSSHGRTLLLDAGPDLDEQLDGVRLRRLDAVLLTHEHRDATGGLARLERRLLREGRRAKVYAHPGTVRRLRARYPGLSALELVATTPRERLAFGPLEAQPLRVLHGDVPTLGYRFTDGDGAMAYASDAHALPADTARRLDGIPMLVLDGAMWLGRRMSSHLAADQAIRLATRLRAGTLVLTQIGHGYPPHAEAERAVRALLRSLDVARPSGVRLAYDGLALDVAKVGAQTKRRR